MKLSHFATFSSIVLASCFQMVSASEPMQVIAHRGGTADAPENTLYAISNSLKNKADSIWITVQLSKDGVPVLYRPSDLKVLTEREGKVSDYTSQELSKFDVSKNYDGENGPLPKDANVRIPTLQQVLKAFPHTFFYIDIKSPDVSPDVMAEQLVKVVQEEKSTQRVRIYSTQSTYLSAINKRLPVFIDRDTTRSALVNIALNHKCQIKSNNPQGWYAFELNRQVKVTEAFTLGEGVSSATLSWDKEMINCLTQGSNNHIIILGVNSDSDYCKAKSLNVFGVVVDSPKKFALNRPHCK